MYATMKAAVLRGKEDLQIEQVPMPKAGPGELVVRVDAALTCGTDLKVFRRGYHAKMLTKDRLFGHEIAGTVVEAGEGVREFGVGERVLPLNSAPCDECFYCRQGQQNLCDDLLFNNGAYAEYLLVPERIVQKNTLRIPEGMSAEHAALTEPLACVVRGLEESGAKAGQTAIVLGAGPIGLLFVHAAAIEGLHVIAVVKRTDQVAAAKLFGAEQVVRIADVDDPVTTARALTPEGRGADLVFEAVATPEAWQWAVQMVRKGGVVNWFGGPPAGTDVKLDTNLIHYSDLTLKASFHHTPGTVRRAFAMIGSGKFSADAFLTGTATLDDVPSVFQRMLTRPGEGMAPEIKTVVYPHPNRAAETKSAAPELVAEGAMNTRPQGVVYPFGSLDGAPEVYLTPVTRPSLEHALLWCKQLATTHYENFHVTSIFLPKRLRAHFYSVYAFCRTSDDLGDEVGDTKTATRLLNEWRAMLHECFEHPELSRHPVYVSLQPTIQACGLPIEPFDDLITAFAQDQVYTKHESLKTLEEYSKYSANPVGRLVLLLSGYHDEGMMRLSDEICTGLQLANFYQDVVTDWVDRGRRYLPADVMKRFNVTDAQVEARRFDANFRAMMQFLVADARARLQRGEKITTMVERDLAATLRLFVRGGNAILDAIAAQDYDTLQDRPVVTKAVKLRLLGGALVGRVSAALRGRSSPQGRAA